MPPRRKPAKARPTARKRRPAAEPVAPDYAAIPASRSLGLRELFWNNVVREMLTNLSMLSMRLESESKRPGADLKAIRAEAQVFDGRMAVLTRRGQRVPIARVLPVFACGVTGTPENRALSVAVECTVFEIVTPSGEVWTMPVSEVRAVHALTEQLLRQIEREEQAGQSRPKPFGFAAFTSLAAPRARRGRDNTRGGTSTDAGGPASRKSSP